MPHAEYHYMPSCPWLTVERAEVARLAYQVRDVSWALIAGTRFGCPGHVGPDERFSCRRVVSDGRAYLTDLARGLLDSIIIATTWRYP